MPRSESAEKFGLLSLKLLTSKNSGIAQAGEFEELVSDTDRRRFD
jgi:hypothetical protein